MSKNGHQAHEAHGNHTLNCVYRHNVFILPCFAVETSLSVRLVKSMKTVVLFLVEVANSEFSVVVVVVLILYSNTGQ